MEDWSILLFSNYTFKRDRMSGGEIFYLALCYIYLLSLRYSMFVLVKFRKCFIHLLWFMPEACQKNTDMHQKRCDSFSPYRSDYLTRETLPGDSMILKTGEFIALTHICIFLKKADHILRKHYVEYTGALRPIESQWILPNITDCREFWLTCNPKLDRWVWSNSLLKG